MPKKSFKDNPALQFISAAVPQQAAPAVPQAPIQEDVPMKPNPLFVETKSKRVQLLMQPSLHHALKEIAVQKGVSFNELVHSALAQYAEGERGK